MFSWDNSASEKEALKIEKRYGTCSTCGGRGVLEHEVDHDGDIDIEEVTCGRCHGTGKVEY